MIAKRSHYIFQCGPNLMHSLRHFNELNKVVRISDKKTINSILKGKKEAVVLPSAYARLDLRVFGLMRGLSQIGLTNLVCKHTSVLRTFVNKNINYNFKKRNHSRRKYFYSIAVRMKNLFLNHSRRKMIGSEVSV